jgi:hypothetical protein
VFFINHFSRQGDVAIKQLAHPDKKEREFYDMPQKIMYRALPGKCYSDFHNVLEIRK